ncbi:hypothetical protein JTB14_035323 [Gonioctena quinquepunctata]|nr:hypothetical protein JTB14_035323 [Gonioctena quinquepunctata]
MNNRLAIAKESRNDALLHHILQELGDPPVSKDILKSYKATISRVSHKIDQRWSKSGRHRERFLTANSSWLEENISVLSVRLSMMSHYLKQEAGSERPHKDSKSSRYKTKRHTSTTYSVFERVELAPTW